MRALEGRADVLVFTSEPLEQDPHGTVRAVPSGLQPSRGARCRVRQRGEDRGELARLVLAQALEGARLEGAEVVV